MTFYAGNASKINKFIRAKNYLGRYWLLIIKFLFTQNYQHKLQKKNLLNKKAKA